MILRSYERNFCNCVKKPEKFRVSTGFEPVTSRYRCDALTNWSMKPLTLGAGHLWVPMFPWGMNQRWNDIWNGSYMNCGYEIKWSYAPCSYERNFCNCVKKAEKFRTSTGFHTSFHRWFIPHGNIRTHKWPAPNVSGFIAQLVRASHRYREVTGSNPVEHLNFSGFFTQLQKLRL